MEHGDGEKLAHEHILTRSGQKETQHFCESLHLEISVKSSRVLMGSSNNAAAREERVGEIPGELFFLFRCEYPCQKPSDIATRWAELSFSLRHSL